MTEAANHPSQRGQAPRATVRRAKQSAIVPLQAFLAAGVFVFLSLSATISFAKEPSAHQAADLSGVTLPVEPVAADDARLHPLTDAEAVRYQRIFDLQQAGRFTEADRLIRELHNKVLLSHVQSQRYLHPRYRTHYKELAEWLGAYPDHPDARRIYTLALKRKPAKVAAPRVPAAAPIGRPLSINAGVGEPPARPWNAALQTFRKGHYAAAARQFEAIARSSNLASWAQSAAAYWTARAYLLARQPHEVTPWLEEAARHPRTFYGLIARETLGLEPDLDLRTPPLDAKDLAALLELPAGLRAAALLQIGETERAEQELSTVSADSPAVVRAALVLASRANMPSLSLRLGGIFTQDDGAFRDTAAYPVPGWRPPEGYEVDRALIFAVMRQESAFNTQARSPVGATGLMQLMPATASFMAEGERFRGANRHRLYEPEINISLGQRYIRYLLSDETVSNNLILFAAAYNGGPGNLAKWIKRVDVADDPLLFIENIPSRETRIFIERVLANLWIYRMRLGQPTDSLTAMAAGEWPMYAGIDSLGDDMDIAVAPNDEPLATVRPARTSRRDTPSASPLPVAGR